MAKVIYEFDENEEKSEIDLINGRHTLAYAIEELRTLRRNLYKGYISEGDLVHIRDKQVLTEEDISKEYEETGKPVGNTKLFVSYDYIERELDRILDSTYHILE